MELKIVISADDSALEFARNLGKLFGSYISQADIEAGLAGKVITATIEPDTMPWEDKVEKGLQYAEQAQAAGEAVAEAAIEKHEQEVSNTIHDLGASGAPDKAAPTFAKLRAKGAAFAKSRGKEAMAQILEKLGAKKLSDLDEKGRVLADQMIDEASNA